MKNVIIKPYDDIYKSQVIELMLDIAAEFDIPTNIKDQPDLDQISTFYQKDNGNFWIALNDNQIVGTIALIDIGNSQSALRKMFTVKEYRGKGVALQLLNILLGWCKEKNINETYLGTRDIFLAAQRFYEKNGFEEIVKFNLPPTFPIMPLDTKFYRHKLN